MSEISSTPQPHFERIDMTKLSFHQLTLLKQQLDQELTVFQDSLQTLKMAQTKFQESGSCLDKITPEAKGKEILVPLTGSMYVLGKMGDTDSVLIDIGTNYFAEKNIEEAKTYFENRVSQMNFQMGRIQDLGVQKSKIRDGCVEIMEMKLQALGTKDPAERT